MRVSERMIRSDISDIEAFLRLRNMKLLQRIDKQTLTIKNDSTTVNLLYELVNQKDIVTSSYLPEERVLEILYRMAMCTSSITIDQLADQLLVSKSTVVKDLERIKQQYNSDNFYIKGNLEGMHIEGKEIEIRRRIVNSYIYNMDRSDVVDIAELILNADKKITYRVYWHLFEDVDLSFIKSCIEIIKTVFVIQLFDMKFLLLAGHLCILLKRMQDDNFIEPGEYRVTDSRCQILCNTLFNKIEHYVHKKLPESEKEYILYILYLANFSTYNLDYPFDQKEYKDVVHDFILHMKEVTNIDFSKIPNLDVSVANEIQNIYIQRVLKNPVTKNVITLHDEIYNRMFVSVRRASKVLNKFLNGSLKDNEIWLLAYHYISAYQRIYDSKKHRVLIVSNKSEELISLLVNHLLDIYDIEIIAVIGSMQLHQTLEIMQVDYIISTLQIEVSTIQTIVIHPLLNQKDIALLNTYLSTHKNYYAPSLKKEIQTKDLLDEKTCVRNICFHDTDTLFSYISKQWYDLGFITMPVTDLLRNSYEKLKVEICEDANIAIISVRVHEIVNKSSAFIVTLPEPMVWKENQQEVDIIVTVISTDNHNHIVASMELYDALQDISVITKLRNSSTNIEILQAFIK